MLFNKDVIIIIIIIIIIVIIITIIIINKTGEKVFCLQIRIKLKSCVTLFSWVVHKQA